MTTPSRSAPTVAPGGLPDRSGRRFALLSHPAAVAAVELERIHP
jgi:hypothetical protein